MPTIVYSPTSEEKRQWSEGLTANRMSDCRWLKRLLVGEFEFL
jgi:hypothetical protein